MFFYFQFGQWRYRVVRAGRVLTQTDDGAYIDRLVFEHISKDDSGTYICVATNSVGYSFREANVRVLPPPSNYASNFFSHLNSLISMIKENKREYFSVFPL